VIKILHIDPKTGKSIPMYCIHIIWHIPLLQDLFFKVDDMTNYKLFSSASRYQNTSPVRSERKILRIEQYLGSGSRHFVKIRDWVDGP